MSNPHIVRQIKILFNLASGHIKYDKDKGVKCMLAFPLSATKVNIYKIYFTTLKFIEFFIIFLKYLRLSPIICLFFLG